MLTLSHSTHPDLCNQNPFGARTISSMALHHSCAHLRAILMVLLLEELTRYSNRDSICCLLPNFGFLGGICAVSVQHLLEKKPKKEGEEGKREELQNNWTFG